jgi:hypothetical protein
VRPKAAKAPGGERPLFQGTAAEVLGDIRTYQALGVTHFVFDATHPDLKSVVDNMQRFAHDVRPEATRTATTRVAERSRRPSGTAHPRSKPASRAPLQQSRRGISRGKNSRKRE